MNELIRIFGSACGALFFIEVVGGAHLMKRFIWGKEAYMHRLKPFDCAPCLSFWLCSIPGFILGKNTLELLYMSVIASILAVFISKMLNK